MDMDNCTGTTLPASSNSRTVCVDGEVRVPSCYCFLCCSADLDGIF